MLADPNADGTCMDIVRVRERGSTLFEFCGTVAGVRVISNSNMLTLDFVASKRFYNARGFLLQYQGKKKKERSLNMSDAKSVANTRLVMNARLTRE